MVDGTNPGRGHSQTGPHRAGGFLAARMPPSRVAVHRGKQGGSTMNIRPDPTFHASPKLAMEAPPESFAYTVLLSPDASKPDALAVIDVNPSSQNYSQIVHTVTMPNKGDEFH